MYSVVVNRGRRNWRWFQTGKSVVYRYILTIHRLCPDHISHFIRGPSVIRRNLTSHVTLTNGTILESEFRTRLKFARRRNEFRTILFCTAPAKHCPAKSHAERHNHWRQCELLAPDAAEAAVYAGRIEGAHRRCYGRRIYDKRTPDTRSFAVALDTRANVIKKFIFKSTMIPVVSKLM